MMTLFGAVLYVLGVNYPFMREKCGQSLAISAHRWSDDVSDLITEGFSIINLFELNFIEIVRDFFDLVLFLKKMKILEKTQSIFEINIDVNERIQKIFSPRHQVLKCNSTTCAYNRNHTLSLLKIQQRQPRLQRHELFLDTKISL
jgi:hypothetical protein